MPGEERTSRTLVATALGWFFCLSLASNAPAEEPAKAFFERLLTRKYYDVALDYLDQVESNASAPADFKREVHLQRARTIYRSTELVPQAAAKERRFEEANAAYAKFVAAEPNHPLAFEARLEMSRLLRHRAALKLSLIKIAEDPKGPEIRKEAGELLKLSSDQFVALKDEIRKRLEPLEAKGGDKSGTLTADEFSARDSLRSQYMIARSDVAESFEAQADSVAENSPERKALLEKATAEYKDVAQKYARYDIGVYARVSEGRCLKKLRDFPAAIKIFSEIVEKFKADGGVVKEAASRELGLQALLEAMECWLDDSQKAYPAAIASATLWISDMQPAEEKDKDWIRLRYLSAVAHKRFADEAKAKNPKDDNAKKAQSEARRLATQVSRLEGPEQAPARKLLGEMGVEIAVAAPAELVKLKTFEEAREAAQDAYSAAVELPERVKIIEERLTIEKDDSQLAELRKELEEAKGGAQKGFQGALAAYRRALQLVTPSTPIEDVNEVRIQLCRCYYFMERYQESSIVGEFVAKRFPTDKQAKFAASIALDAIRKVYLALPPNQREVETQRMMAIAELITKNWPNDDEAAQALRLLISLRIGAKDYEGVITSLSQIPESSPFRAEAESKAGQALWAQYVTKQEELRNAAQGAAPIVDAATEQMKTKAIELLQLSLKRFQGAPPTTASISATVALADVYVKSQNPAQAAALLDDPANGPMTLLSKEETKALFDAALAEHACRVALAAQLALMPTSPDAAAPIAKAGLAMEKLSEILKAEQQNGGDEKRVVAVYYSLAKDLKQQLDLTSDPKVKANLAAGAAKFLQGIRSNTKDPKLLRWVAETLFGFGESFDSPASTADAKKFYSEAAGVLEEILKLDAEKKVPLDPDLKVQLRVKLASAQREMGAYKSAYDTVVSILTDSARRNTVSFQLEAARILTDWGKEPSGKEEYLDQALQGSLPDPSKKTEKIVWGLGKISQLTRRDARYANAFFDSRYLIAECNVGKAKKAKGDQLKARLATAKRDIISVYQAYPQMGGPEWYGKFDGLLKRIQRDLGEPDTGLAGVKKPTPPSAPAITPTKSGS